MFLLLVTLTSMLLAAIMGAIAWRIGGDERRRSEARIAALAAEIDAEPHLATDRDSRFTTMPDGVPPDSDLFAAAAPRAGSRWAAVVSAGVLVLGTAAAVIVLSRGASVVGARAASGPAAPITPRPAAGPLELVALGHEREADRLIVRGVVRNPAAGAPLDRLTAVVFLFSRDGGFLTSGHAALEPSTLRPGSDTSFAVTVPGAAGVGRYRVSFRTTDGIVPHVDRRDAAQGTF
jgi:hypothetical protein